MWYIIFRVNKLSPWQFAVEFDGRTVTYALSIDSDDAVRALRAALKYEVRTIFIDE